MIIESQLGVDQWKQARRSHSSISRETSTLFAQKWPPLWAGWLWNQEVGQRPSALSRHNVESSPRSRDIFIHLATTMLFFWGTPARCWAFSHWPLCCFLPFPVVCRRETAVSKKIWQRPIDVDVTFVTLHELSCRFLLHPVLKQSAKVARFPQLCCCIPMPTCCQHLLIFLMTAWPNKQPHFALKHCKRDPGENNTPPFHVPIIFSVGAIVREQRQKFSWIPVRIVP